MPQGSLLPDRNVSAVRRRRFCAAGAVLGGSGMDPRVSLRSPEGDEGCGAAQRSYQDDEIEAAGSLPSRRCAVPSHSKLAVPHEGVPGRPPYLQIAGSAWKSASKSRASAVTV